MNVLVFSIILLVCALIFAFTGSAIEAFLVLLVGSALRIEYILETILKQLKQLDR